MSKEKIITVKRNGHIVEFTPIVVPCTYHSPDPKTGICRNCDGTRKYVDGYYMIIDNKTAFTVDTIK